MFCIRAIPVYRESSQFDNDNYVYISFSSIMYGQISNLSYQSVGRRSKYRDARICAEMRRTLKASKLRECENINLFRHFIILYGCYSIAL